MPWIRKQLHGKPVWARCDANGELVVKQGRVDVQYRPKDRVYQAALANIRSDATLDVLSDEEAEPSPQPQPSVPTVPLQHAADAVHIYTDGACTNNPGPMGIGVVVMDAQSTKEHSEFLGIGTNNIAELTAIFRALQLTATKKPIVIYTDSAYAIGVLTKRWKLKANQELVLRIRQLIATFPSVRFQKVAGHAGIPANERCDELARMAIAQRKSMQPPNPS